MAARKVVDIVLYDDMTYARRDGAKRRGTGHVFPDGRVVLGMFAGPQTYDAMLVGNVYASECAQAHWMYPEALGYALEAQRRTAEVLAARAAKKKPTNKTPEGR